MSISGESTSDLLSTCSSNVDEQLDWKKKYEDLFQQHMDILKENTELYEKLCKLSTSNQNLLIENHQLELKCDEFQQTKQTLLSKLRRSQKKVKKAEAETVAANTKILDDGDVENIMSMLEFKLQSLSNAVIEEITGEKPGPAESQKEKAKRNMTLKFMSLIDKKKYELLMELKKDLKKSSENSE